MQRHEALRLLGLDESATHEEVKEAFRQLARRSHPDHGGDADDFLRLVEARDVALGDGGGSSLMHLRDVRDIVVAATGAMAERDRRRDRHEETEAVVRHLVRVRTTRLRRLRRSLTLLSLVSAVVGGLSQSIRLIPSFERTWANGLTIGFGTLALVLGLAIAAVTQQVTDVQANIDEVSETLDDRTNLVRIIRTVLASAGVEAPWTTDSWFQAVAVWFGDAHGRWESRDGLPRYAHRVGVNEFARLVLAKAKEHEVIAEHEQWVDDELLSTFSFNRKSRPS